MKSAAAFCSSVVLIPDPTQDTGLIITRMDQLDQSMKRAWGPCYCLPVEDNYPALGTE